MICFVKIGTTGFIISVLNSFEKNTQFTFKGEHDETISFLDILIDRKRSDITTAIYRKSTRNDVCLNWTAFAPAVWKRETLKTLVEEAYVIWSTDQLLERELKYLEKVFYEKNNYPTYIVKQILDKAFEERSRKKATNIILDEQNETEHTTKKKHMLALPYQGKKGDFIIKSIKKRFRNLLPQCTVPKVVFTSSKLSSKMRVKDRIILAIIMT